MRRGRAGGQEPAHSCPNPADPRSFAEHCQQQGASTGSATGQHSIHRTHLHCVHLEADGLGAHTDIVGNHISDEEISHQMLAWRGRLRRKSQQGSASVTAFLQGAQLLCHDQPKSMGEVQVCPHLPTFLAGCQCWLKLPGNESWGITANASFTFVFLKCAISCPLAKKKPKPPS